MKPGDRIRVKESDLEGTVTDFVSGGDDEEIYVLFDGDDEKTIYPKKFLEVIA